MKRFLLRAFYSGFPFGLIFGILAAFGVGLEVGVVIGMLSGLLFGISMAAFVDIQRRRVEKKPPDFSDEQLLWDGPANHFLRGESVGGWLYLTTRRLLFRSHPINLQPHEIDLPLAEIAQAAAVRTAWLIPNGLLISTVSGKRERFVVEQHKRWSAEIASARMRAGDTK